MPIQRLLLSLTLAVLLLPAATASAGFRPGGPTPGVCSGAAFTDVLGTSAGDELRGGDRPERIYGLSGADTLRGSGLRATCLFGGLGTDIVALGPAGGIGLGEDGADLLLGTDKDDGLSGGPGPDLLFGGGGRDALRGDTGIDGYAGGFGDDIVEAGDGRREVVSCGGGDDVVAADRSDVVFGCERVRLQGRRLPTLRVTSATDRARSTYRLTFRAPTAGGAGTYAVLAARCDESEPFEATVVPSPGRRVRAGQTIRVGLRAPRGGWCRGTRTAALVRRPRCETGQCLVPLPYEPLASITFRVGG